MSDRFIRHNITGSEADQPRPIAYLSSGWPRRRRRLQSRGARSLAGGLWLAAVALGMALWAAVVAMGRL